MKRQIFIISAILLSTFGCQSSEETINVEKVVSSEKIIPAVEQNQIVEKYWKLKTLAWKEVEMTPNQTKEIYFMLKLDGNRVKGFAGCNSMHGSYKLSKGNRIEFGKMASTMMFCPEINDLDFLSIFDLADNYTIKDDVLSLNIGKRAPLATFEAVYF